MILRLLSWALALGLSAGRAETFALWLFDEHQGLYPSSVLNDAGPNGYILILGRGARMAEGRFGRALEPWEAAPLSIRMNFDKDNPDAGSHFGLVPARKPADRSVEPMHWGNATFAALFTSGEKHLRSPGFANATRTKLNLGAFDWTVEFWFQAAGRANGEGVVFEIGEGPRGENGRVTRLVMKPDRGGFRFHNQAAGVTLEIASDAAKLRSGWRHLAFVYNAADRQLRHYLDGALQPLPERAGLRALDAGEEAYFSVGRDGMWNRPLAGRMDELRFSDAQVYRGPFEPPGSFSITYGGRLPKTSRKAGPPLLFGKQAPRQGPVRLGSRKHLFLDDAIVAEAANITFTPNPPRRMEKVLEEVGGHLSMVEDEQGVLRLYYKGPHDSLAVMTSRDGVRWHKPDLGRGEYFGERNIVLRKPVGLGVVFLDPNAPEGDRWRYFSGIRRQGMYLFRSPDGFSFTQHEVAAVPFAAGSQSALYYDDQRQIYAAHHRSDYGATPAGSTRRRFVLSEVEDLLGLWPFEQITPQRTAEAAKREPIKADKLHPWFLDNGPLAPSGVGIELPTVFAADDEDPVATDIYTTKAVKYPWAPDAYLAFPGVYFHYWEDGPETRQALGRQERGLGSGVVETQLAVSRDGRDWRRYRRPAYVPIGGDGSDSVHMVIMTHGVFRRGNEIWQYAGGHGGGGVGYHSPWTKGAPSPLWRFVQRLDGFVAAEAAYGGGALQTKPLVFEGNQLRLNIDTGATGYAQVGLLDEQGKAIPGYSAEECVYINGDHLDEPVEWLGRGSDLSALEGRTIQVLFLMRGTRLYAMQFTR